MKRFVKFVLLLLFIFYIPSKVSAQVPTGQCSDALPFCTGSPVDFPAGTDVPSPIVNPDGGDGVGCLGSTPNPAWYYMRIGVAGSIDIQMIGSDGSLGAGQPTNDIDFICWGPFNSQASMCTSVSDFNYADDPVNYVGCSYSGSAIETFTIPNALVGEYYLLLITNYSNVPCSILFENTGGNGQTDCGILCANSITAIPTACDPATNNYTLSGRITVVGPPLTGTLTVTDGNGGSQVFNAPFANTINYSISSLPSNGGAYSVTAEFSDDNVCTATANYTAPGSCLFCNITAASSGPACEGDDVNLTATNVNSGCTYSWTGPNGYTSNLQNPVLVATTAGMSGPYTATVVNPANNCTSTSTVVLNVYPIPVVPTIISNSPICPGAILQLSGPAPTAGASAVYVWSGPNGFVGNTQTVSIPAMQASAAGDYTLVITENGCVSPIGSSTVALFPLPIPNAGPDVATCSAAAIQIGAAATPGFSYSWSPITGLDLSTLSNPTVLQSNTTGNQLVVTYTVTVSDANCSASDAVDVTINPQPTASFLTPSPQCFDVNSFNFDAEGSYSSSAQFEWTFGPFASPSASTNESPLNISFSSTGQQNVSLKIKDRGCESTVFQAPILVYEMPVANFDADSYEGCDPKLISFSNLTTSTDPISSYQWTFGGGRGSALANPDILFNNPGIFDVSLIATSSKGCRNTYKIQGMIRINPTPVADFNLNPTLMTITDPHTYIKDMSVGSDLLRYKVTKLEDIFQPNPKITFPDTGTYFITQVVETQFGCKDSTVKEAVVEFGFKIYIPNTFTPNDDGINDRFRPYGEDVSEYSMQIFSRWGQLLYTSYDMENGWDGRSGLSNKIDAGGLYIYKISAFDKRGVKTNFEGTVVLLK